MKVLVTGATGLCGNAVIDLICGGGIYCVGYSRSKPYNGISDCIYEAGDLTDSIRIAEVMKKHSITHVIHSGAFSHPLMDYEIPEHIVQTNINGTMNMLYASRLMNVERFIYISSGAVYGNSRAKKMHETDACFPTSVYGVTKLTGEGLVRAFKNLYDMSAVSLRLCYIYGPGRTTPDALRDMLSNAIQGKDIVLEKGADQQLEYLFVTDCAEAIISALFAKEIPYDEVNIGSGTNATIRDVAKSIHRIFPEIRVDLHEGSLGFDTLGSFDCSRAKKWLGFEAHTSLDDGIEKYSEWLKEK